MLIVRKRDKFVTGYATGIRIANKSYIITCAHIVHGAVLIKYGEYMLGPGKIKCMDHLYDLALIQVPRIIPTSINQCDAHYKNHYYRTTADQAGDCGKPVYRNTTLVGLVHSYYIEMDDNLQRFVAAFERGCMPSIVQIPRFPGYFIISVDQITGPDGYKLLASKLPGDTVGVVFMDVNRKCVPMHCKLETQ